MRVDLAALALGVLVIVAFLFGRIFAYFGILPHVGYLLTGQLFGAGLAPPLRGYLFVYAVGFLLAYLGYMASSRRIFSAPLQLFFVHPLRVVVGFALFFTALYFAGLGIEIAALAALLLSTSSALVVRWGRRASYALIERSILSMDALLSGIVLLYVLGEPFHSILLGVAGYVLLLFSSGPVTSVLVLLAFAFLAFKGVMGYAALSFVLGVVLHHLLNDLRMGWAEGAMQDVLPLVFLVGAGAWAGLNFGPFAGVFLLVIAFLSFLQNFISLVVLGPVFGVSPKTGAHILARTLGPSEAAVFALAVLTGTSNLSLAVYWFYLLALVFSSFVRTERDAEHLLRSLFPASLFRAVERLENAYASIFVRNHVVFSSAYRHRMISLSRRMLLAILVVVMAVSAVGYLALHPEISHRVIYIFFSVAAFTVSVIKLVEWYVRFYEETIYFVSEHAYGGKLRPGRTVQAVVAGFLLVVAGFITIPASIPFTNLVMLFFSLIVLNTGLFILLRAHSQIYIELIKKAEYAG